MVERFMPANGHDTHAKSVNDRLQAVERFLVLFSEDVSMLEQQLRPMIDDYEDGEYDKEMKRRVKNGLR